MRDSKIELFRCACMFGVVLLHALTQGGYADAHRGLDNLMTPSVVGFCFISGYFGIKCRLKGVLKILGIGLSSWLVLAVFNMDFTNSFGIGGFWWFLWMYLALMTMAPLTDAIFGKMAQGGIVKIVPFVIVVYVWSYAATKVPVLKEFVPSVDGFSPFGVLTFLAVYLVARASRCYEDRFRIKWLIVSVVASGAMCWIGFYHYNSPFALILAGSLFYLFKRMPVPSASSRVGKVILAISPSMFSVYLLHTNGFGFELLRSIEDALMATGWNYYLMSVVVAIGVYTTSVVLDIPRRIVAHLIASKFHR